jgi:hypothetical protein
LATCSLAGSLHVPRGGQEDGFGVVAQLQARHGIGGGGDGFGKLLPLINDSINVLHDEIG